MENEKVITVYLTFNAGLLKKYYTAKDYENEYNNLRNILKNFIKFESYCAIRFSGDHSFIFEINVNTENVINELTKYANIILKIFALNSQISLNNNLAYGVSNDWNAIEIYCNEKNSDCKYKPKTLHERYSDNPNKKLEFYLDN